MVAKVAKPAGRGRYTSGCLRVVHTDCEGGVVDLALFQLGGRRPFTGDTGGNVPSLLLRRWAKDLASTFKGELYDYREENSKRL